MSDLKSQMKAIATETIQRSGVPAVTFRELGKAVGIKSSSVIYHFENKQGLLREVAEDYIRAGLDHLRNVGESLATPAQKLDALVAMYEEVLEGDKICLGGMLAAQEQMLNTENREIVRQFFEKLEAWVAGVLRESDTSLTAARAATRARGVVAGLQGALLLDKVSSKPVHLPAIKEAIREQLS